MSFTLLLEYPSVIAAIFICGIGGTFQFGFSVSSMTSPSVFIQELVNVTCVERYGCHLEPWQLDLIWSFTMSIFCLGGLLSSLLANPLVSKFGRKKCLLLNSFPALIGALLMLLSKTVMSFEIIMVARFLYGINSGLSVIAHTLYLVECAPKRLRGMVGVSVATFISLGKFCGQLMGISELLGTRERWPWLLAFPGLTSLLQLVTLPLLPESPSFLLLEKGDQQACEQALKKLWGDKDYSCELQEMLKEKAVQQNLLSHSVMDLLRNTDVRWQLISILVTFTSLQLCGINAVYLYSFEVFRRVGIHEDKLRYAALGTGMCELLASAGLFMIIQSTGKKVLLFRGYMAMSATLVLLTITIYLQTHLSWMPYCSMVLVFLFIFFFASGPAGASTPLPGELFTEAFRSAAFTIGTLLNWTGLFLLVMLFPVVEKTLHYFCFLIFLFFCAPCGLYVRFYMPETKNRSPLEIAAEFQKIHAKSKTSKVIQSSEPTWNGSHAYETKL